MIVLNMRELSDWNIEEMCGYKPITTLYKDFSIADKFGIGAIEDTYKRAFKDCKIIGYKYMTELVMVLNWKIWEHYQDNERYAILYNDLWEKAQNWCYDNFTEEELRYYYRTTD